MTELRFSVRKQYIWQTAVISMLYTLLHIIASVLTAGALGNFIDRLRLGYVVDFFYFSLINFPVFNVADIFVVISFIGIAVSILFIYKDDEFEFLSIRKKESKA